MGTWGAGPLENDTAVDWMYGLGEVADLSLIEGTLDRALAFGDDFLRRRRRRGSARRRGSRRAVAGKLREAQRIHTDDGRLGELDAGEAAP